MEWQLTAPCLFTELRLRYLKDIINRKSTQCCFSNVTYYSNTTSNGTSSKFHGIINMLFLWRVFVIGFLNFDVLDIFPFEPVLVSFHCQGKPREFPEG